MNEKILKLVLLHKQPIMEVFYDKEMFQGLKEALIRKTKWFGSSYLNNLRKQYGTR